MTRAQVVATVAAYVAEDGRVAARTLRGYVDHRMSRQAFDQAVARGLATCARTHPAEHAQG